MEYSKFGTDDTYSKYTKENNKFIFHELVDDVSNLDFMDPANHSHFPTTGFGVGTWLTEGTKIYARIKTMAPLN